MIFLFKNDLGELALHAGPYPSTGIFIKSMQGLGFVATEDAVVSYVNQPGQVVVSQKDPARVITLSCDIVGRDNSAELLRRMIRILRKEGRLTVCDGVVRRAIRCRCTHVEEPERKSRHIFSTVLQFTCDCPYFTDAKERQVTLFERRDLVQGSFTLPCVFTERVHRCIVYNQGDFRAEPVFRLYNTKTAETVESAADILFVNHTTGQKIVLTHLMTEGEVVTVDIPNRKVESSVCGNLISFLSQDSYLSDFWLEQGVNDLEIINHNTETNTSVLLCYDNQYIEAVM